MTFPAVVLFSLVVLALVGLACLVRIARDRKENGQVGGVGAAMIWFVYGGFTVLTILVSWWNVWLLPAPRNAAVAAGGVVLLTGLLFVGGGMAAFGSVRRMSGRDCGRLIRTGVYRWSRNPQNVGWALCLLGGALMGRSGLALAFAGLFAVGFYIYVPTEERYLETVFGEEWRRYRNEVPRFFGLPAQRAPRRRPERRYGRDEANAAAR